MPDSYAVRIEIDTRRVIAPVPPLLFGGFAEHIGRCIYGGIYDPAAPHADAHGLRKDVLAALSELKLPIIRYPGGNFVSGYDWRDGVGPRASRPRRRELAWRSIETNQFGTDEFMQLCRTLGAEPMLGLNFGTGSIQDAADLVEYCNAPAGTKYADLRIANGSPAPHDVKYWCLGNEMDGPWQIGALPADEYGRKAREAAKLMRIHDPSIKTILCGSSGPFMSSFPQWDRTVLEIAWEQTDYLSLHNYATNYEDNTPAFLAYTVELERQVETLSRIIREVRQKLGSTRDIRLSWDEWNVWYKDRRADGEWKEAPHLCEEIYNLEDALVVAQWMSVLLRRCDVIAIACIAQIVNVISPILTSRDGLLKQTTFYPFQLFSRHAEGNALDLTVTCPRYETSRFGDAPLLDVSATHDPATDRGAVFIVNRSLSRTLETDIVWNDRAPESLRSIWQLAGRDPKAANTWQDPERVVPEEIDPPALAGGRVRLPIPPLSFSTVLY